MMTSSSEGAHRIQTVRATGSSSALSRASAARSVSRSASSMMITRQRRDRRPVRGQRRPGHAPARPGSTGPRSRGPSTSAWVASTAVRHSRQCPHPPSRALQRRGEGAGGHGATRPGRPGEQPGVGHRGRVGHRALERLDGALLADDVGPDAHEPRLQQRRDRARARRRGCRRRLPSAAHDEVALRLARGQVEEVLAHPPVEVVGLGLEPVVHVAATRRARPRGGDVEDHGEVGEQAAGSPTAKVADLVGPRSRPAPW